MEILEKIKNKTVKITIAGLGYVGLPTAIEFAKKGIKVIGIDIDENKVKMINEGICPINDEKMKKDLLQKMVRENFHATIDYQKAVTTSDVIILVVPTPVNAAKEPDLIFIKNAAKSVSKYLKRNQLVILESTVYPGVTEEIMQPILEESGLTTPEDFGLAYCPERFNPGDKSRTIEKVVRVIGVLIRNGQMLQKNCIQ